MARSFLAATALCFLIWGPVHASPPSWEQLDPQQREVLAPLAEEWNSLDAAKKKKWLGIARRYPQMTPEEQQRTRSHMRDWYSLTPEQRELARGLLELREARVGGTRQLVAANIDQHRLLLPQVRF